MNAVLVDTGAWFALFVPSDSDHKAAREWIERNTLPLITTDYIVDELLTLLKVRGEVDRALAAGSFFFDNKLCRLEFVAPRDVQGAWEVFSTYRDKGWSFTDCVSYVIMKRLAITKAMAFDNHFRQFATVTVMP